MLKLLPAPLKKLAVTRLPRLALPADRLPVILAVPSMFAPVPVITTTLALPIALKFILPLAVGMFTLLLPLLILAPPPPPDCTTQLRLPVPSVLKTYALVPPVIFILPTAPKSTLEADTKLAEVNAINVFALITFALVMLPPEPLPAMILPALRLPVMFAVPDMLAPVPVITTTLALPT